MKPADQAQTQADDARRRDHHRRRAIAAGQFRQYLAGEAAAARQRLETLADADADRNPAPA